MRKKASVSVFLTLCFVLTLSLIFAMLESARTAGARFYLQTITNSMLDSIFAEYSLPLWEGYRILLFSAETKEEAAERLLTYGEAYLEEPSLYRLANPSVAVRSMTRITENGGVYLEKTIGDYMKLAFADYAHKAGDMEKAWEQLRDGEAMGEIGDSYSSHSAAALALERKVLAIEENLKARDKAYENAARELALDSPEGFIHQGETMLSLTERLEGLLDAYRMAADDFSADLSKTKSSNEGRLQELSEEHRFLMEERISSYESYVSEEGDRRRELERAVSTALSQSASISSAISMAEELMVMEEQGESDVPDGDEEGAGREDFSDSEAQEEMRTALTELWEGLDRVTLGIGAARPDKEKENRIHQLESLGSGGLISLLLPEGKTVSPGRMDTRLLPSQTSVESRKDPEGDFLEQMLVNEYIFRYFTDFLSESEDAFSYEIEYILAGKSSDGANLEAVLAKILGIREGMNYLHILGDASKREAADQLAAAITGALGFPQLYILVSLLLIGVWALAESVLDLKDLLKGKRVPFYKEAKDWKLGLEGLMETNVSEWDSGGEKDPVYGLNYKEYLRMLLFILPSAERNYRSMDLMQYNIAGGTGDFLMKNMIYGLEIVYSTDSKRLFSYLVPMGDAGLSPRYSISASGAKSY